jgi:hypothetical protein
MDRRRDGAPQIVSLSGPLAVGVPLAQRKSRLDSGAIDRAATVQVAGELASTSAAIRRAAAGLEQLDCGGTSLTWGHLASRLGDPAQSRRWQSQCLTILDPDLPRR